MYNRGVDHIQIVFLPQKSVHSLYESSLPNWLHIGIMQEAAQITYHQREILGPSFYPFSMWHLNKLNLLHLLVILSANTRLQDNPVESQAILAAVGYRLSLYMSKIPELKEYTGQSCRITGLAC